MSKSFDSYSDVHMLNRSSQNDRSDSISPRKPAWGIEGYQVPRKTQLYITKGTKIGRGKVQSLFTDAEKRSREPSPVAYSPKSEQMAKMYWLNATGGFAKGKRRTIIEDAIKIGPQVPGPGAYHKLEKGKVAQSPNKILLGVVTKSEGIDFLSNAQYLGEEVPGAGQYFTKEDDRKKAYSYVDKRLPVYKYHAPIPEKPLEKAPVGPGYLPELEVAFSKEVDIKRTPKYQFGKSSPASTVSQQANITKHNPGVGHYKEVEKGFGVVNKKEPSAFISKYNSMRFTDSLAKSKKWVPGPGAYNVLPPLNPMK